MRSRAIAGANRARVGGIRNERRTSSRSTFMGQRRRTLSGEESAQMFRAHVQLTSTRCAQSSPRRSVPPMVGVPRVSQGDGCTCRHASKAAVTASVARICSISRYLSAGSAPLSCVAARAAQPASVVHEAPGAAERLELRQPPSCRRRRRTCRRRRRQEGGEALVAERVTVEIEPPQRGQCQHARAASRPCPGQVCWPAVQLRGPASRS